MLIPSVTVSRVVNVDLSLCGIPAAGHCRDLPYDLSEGQYLLDQWANYNSSLAFLPRKSLSEKELI